MAQAGADGSGMEQWKRWEGVGLVLKQLDVLVNWMSPVREGKKKSRIIPYICLRQLEKRRWDRGREGIGKTELRVCLGLLKINMSLGCSSENVHN